MTSETPERPALLETLEEILAEKLQIPVDTLQNQRIAPSLGMMLRQESDEGDPVFRLDNDSLYMEFTLRGIGSDDARLEILCVTMNQDSISMILTKEYDLPMFLRALEGAAGELGCTHAVCPEAVVYENGITVQMRDRGYEISLDFDGYFVKPLRNSPVK